MWCFKPWRGASLLFASDVGGIAEILRTKNLCPPDNSDALSRHIEMALAIPKAIAKTQRLCLNLPKAAFDAGTIARNVTAFSSACYRTRRNGLDIRPLT